MEQQETCQAIWRYKTESKSPEIIFSTLEHLDKQPRKEILLPKKKKKPTKPKTRGIFPGGWAGHKQNLVCFLWDHPASIHGQLLPWHSTENMFANVSFVVCVWITKTEKLRLLVVANCHFLRAFLFFQGDKKIPSTLFHNMSEEWAISH